jgi:hypothetical protein
MKSYTLRSYTVLLTVPVAQFTAFIASGMVEGLDGREATLQHVRQSTLEPWGGDEARMVVLRLSYCKESALIRPQRANSRDRSGRRRIMQLTSPLKGRHQNICSLSRACMRYDHQKVPAAGRWRWFDGIRVTKQALLVWRCDCHLSAY